MADHLREFIQLPVPHVGPLSYGELHMTLVDVIGRDGSVAVAQRFVGGGIHGEALVCLRGKNINQIGERLGYLLEFTPHNEITHLCVYDCRRPFTSTPTHRRPNTHHNAKQRYH